MKDSLHRTPGAPPLERRHSQLGPPTRANSLHTGSTDSFDSTGPNISKKLLLQKIDRALAPEVSGLGKSDRKGLLEIKEKIKQATDPDLLSDYGEMIDVYTQNISESPPETAPQTPVAQSLVKGPNAPHKHEPEPPMTYSERLSNYKKLGFDQASSAIPLSSGKVQEFRERNAIEPPKPASTIQEHAQQITLMAKNQTGLEVKIATDFEQYNALSPIGKIVNNARRRVESYQQDRSPTEQGAILDRLGYSESVRRMADKLFYAGSESLELLAKELLITTGTLDWAIGPEDVLLRKLQDNNRENSEGLTKEQLDELLGHLNKMKNDIQKRKLISNNSSDHMILSNLELASNKLIGMVTKIRNS